MARAKGTNTGKGNYPATRVSSVAGEQLKEGLRNIPKVKFPNRNITTNEYKKGLKKAPEAEE